MVPEICFRYLFGTWYVTTSRPGYLCRGILAVAPDADHPTRTLTRTLWGDLCLDAVACEGSRLIRPKGDAVDGGCAFQTRAPGCAYNNFAF